MRDPVLTKADFVRRYQAGEFGNASPTWLNIIDWAKAGGCSLPGLFHLRNGVKASDTWYNLKAVDLWKLWWAMYGQGYPVHQLYISQMAPTEMTEFQGEVYHGTWGLHLTYTTIPKPMREALAQESYKVFGLLAGLRLKHYLPPPDLEWLEYLLQEYPDHVVEFSTYRVEWGTIPGFRTVYWEVRKY